MEETRRDLRYALKHARLVGILLGALLVVLYLLSGVYTLAPDETGVLSRFGRVVKERIPPGLGYHLPWPVERLYRVRESEIKRMSVGYRMVDRIRGLPPREEESRFLTGDENIIQVEMMVQYRVVDPKSFLFSLENPPFMVRRCVEQALCDRLASLPVDEVLTRGKAALELKVKETAQNLLDAYDAGVVLLATHLQEVRPPSAVAEAFHDVASAREDRNRYISEARGYENRELPKARGLAAATLESGRAVKSETVYRARGQASRFLSVAQEYRLAPEVTRTRLYREKMERILARVKSFVTSQEAGDQVNIRMVRTRTP